MYAPFLRWSVLGRLHLLWVGGCLLSSQASVLGSLLRSSDEMMHTEVGQAQRPGAELGDNQYVSSVDGDRWYQSVPFDGRHPVRGRSNCGSIFLDDQLI